MGSSVTQTMRYSIQEDRQVGQIPASRLMTREPSLTRPSCAPWRGRPTNRSAGGAGGLVVGPGRRPIASSSPDSEDVVSYFFGFRTANL